MKKKNKTKRRYRNRRNRARGRNGGRYGETSEAMKHEWPVRTMAGTAMKNLRAKMPVGGAM